MAGRTATRWALTGVLVLTGLLYAPLRSAPFVYQDENWLPLLPTHVITVSVPSRDLTMASYALTWRLVGFEAGVFHLGNVALHLGNGLLVYAVAAALIGTSAALFAMSLFLLHPLSASAVVYVTGRSDLLMTTGVLVALWASLGRVTPWRWALVGLGLLIAASSKEIGVIGAGLVALTLTVWGRWPAPCVVRQSRVLLGMGAGAVIGAGAALGHAFPRIMNWLTAEASVGGAALGWGDSLVLQTAALWHLLLLAVWPVGFSIDHDVLAIGPVGQGLAVGGALLSLGLIVRWWRTRPLMAWGIAWVAFSVAPRFLFRTSEFITEPQMYLAMVGVSAMAGAGLAALWTWTPRPRLLERTV